MQHERRKTVRTLGAVGFFFPLAGHLRVGARPQRNFLSHVASVIWEAPNSRNLCCSFSLQSLAILAIPAPSFPSSHGTRKDGELSTCIQQSHKSLSFSSPSKIPKTLNFSLEAPEVKVRGERWEDTERESGTCQWTWLCIYFQYRAASPTVQPNQLLVLVHKTYFSLGDPWTQHPSNILYFD